MLLWLHRVAVLVHIGGVVVWMGAVAYYLLILRPAFRIAGTERPARYALLIAIKQRLRLVVGGAVVALLVSGFFNAWVKGYFGGTSPMSERLRTIFVAKMVVVAILILIFLSALRLLGHVHPAARRGRMFNAVHVAVLALGTVASALGVMLGR